MSPSPQSITSSKTLADTLLKEELISQDQYQQAIQEYEQSERSLGRILTEMGAITEGVKIGVLQKRYNCSLITLDKMKPKPEALKLIPKKYCVKYHTIPLQVEDERLVIAIEDPSDIRTINAMEAISSEAVKAMVAKTKDITAVLDRLPDDDEEKKKKEKTGPSWLASLTYYAVVVGAPILIFFNLLIYHPGVQKAWNELQLDAFEQGLIFFLAFSGWTILAYWIHDVIFQTNSSD